MNRQELQSYFNSCLRRYRSGHYAVEPGESWLDNYWRHIALGHAKLLVAKRGVRATMLKREAEAVNREWESDGLADRIQEAIGFVCQQHFDIGHYLWGGVQSAALFDREPTQADAEQASACRLLADAADHFRKAKGYGVEEGRIDALISQCIDPTSLPLPQSGSEPLQSAIAGALTYLQERAPSRSQKTAQEQTDLALFDGLTYPPSDWAFHIEQLVARDGSASALRDQLSKLVAALNQLPEQIEEARQDRRDHLQSQYRDTQPMSEQIPDDQSTPPLVMPIVEKAVGITAPTPSPVPSASSRTFIAVGEDLIANKVQDASWDEKTARQGRALYALFSRVMAEEHGITTFAELRQSHLYAYDQFMRVMHTAYGRSPADKTRTIAQLREISRHKPAEQRGLSIPTRNRHLTQLAALLDQAGTLGEHLDPALNLTRLRSKKSGRSRDQRAVPTEQQIDAYFHSPVFTGCASWKKLHVPGKEIFHRAAYFGPIIAYYQGMRREEYCGLAVDDVVSDNGPHPYLHIGINQFRKLKNIQSQRNLALHSELIRLGFLDYVAALKDAGHDRLFPDLYSPGSSSLLGDRLYKELEPLRRKLNISPHQFRHMFNDELKQQRVPQEFRADMLGHGGTSETTERYCNPVSIALQIEELHKIKVRTAHIERRPIQLLPWVQRGETPPWSNARRKKPAAKAS